SSIEKNLRRSKLVEKFATRRAELKAVLKDPKVADEAFYKAQRELNDLPRDSNPTRLRNRCSITGRPRAFIRRFGVSRLTFRELALGGKLPGVVKSSW
ncbi:MAG TPA: 30S ribosomal protein S14, partial [Opitutales bacterium]|nr:30S ribosomal protein S14 [Opitutales bacterium]